MQQGSGAQRDQAEQPASVADELRLVAQAQPVVVHCVLDRGVLQDGEPFLAGTAPSSVARLSSATAASVGVHEGERLEVSTKHGSIILPVVITQMPDYVVWVPTNSTDSAVRATLGAAHDQLDTSRTVVDGFWYGLSKRSWLIG